MRKMMIVIVALLGIFSFSAGADILLDWEFSDGCFVGSQSDPIVLTMTLTNLPESDDDLVWVMPFVTTVWMSFEASNRDWRSYYLRYWGTPDIGSFWDQFTPGMTLSPGESMELVYSTFVPIVDEVPVGTSIYVAGELHIETIYGTFQEREGTIIFVSPTSESATNSGLIPEPATVVLLGVGLVGLAFKRKKSYYY